MSIPRLRPTPILYLASVLILSLLVLWGFGQVLRFDFLTPETWHGIQDLSGKHVLVVQSGGQGRLGQPLPLVATHLSLVLDRAFWGSNALGYHLTNLLLHLTGVLLGLLILYELTGDWVLSGVAAAVYAVHPLHLQVVAPVTSRSELIAICLFCGAFLAYLRYRREDQRGWLFLMGLLYLLTLLEKPSAVGLGLLILAYDRLFLPEERRSPRLGWGLLGAALGLLLLFHLTGRIQAPWAGYKGGPVAVLLSGAANLGRYAQVVFWPRHSTFGLDLAVPSVAAGLAGLAGFAGLAGLLWLLARRTGSELAKVCLFGLIWFGATLLAEVNLLYANLNLFAAAHLTLALLGAVLLVLAPLRAMVGDQAEGVLALLVIVIGLAVGLSAVSFSRSALWQDAHALWDSVRERDPENYWASYHLSLYYAWKNREEFNPRKIKANLEHSRDAIERAIASSSRGRYVLQERNYLHKAKLLNDLAGAEIGLAAIGLVKRAEAEGYVEQCVSQALESCQRAREIYQQHKKEGRYHDPQEAELTESNLETVLGSLFERKANYKGGRDKGELEKAAAHFEVALKLNETAMTLSNLAKVYLDLGRDADAQRLLDRSIERFPEAEAAYIMRGTLASNAKQPAKALEFFQLGLARARYPASRIDLHTRMAQVYTNLREFQAAETAWSNVLKIDPGNYVANWELVGLFINQRRWPEAIRRLNSLITHHPKAPRPRDKLSEIYRKMGDSLFEKLGRKIIAGRRPPREGPVNDVELINAAASNPEVLARLRQIAKLYRDAVAAQPTDPAARNRFAMIYYFEAIGMLMVPNGLKDGIAQLARVVKHFPEYAPARTMIHATVQLLVQHGKWKQVHQALKQAVRHNPDNQLLKGLKVQMDLYAEQERQHPRVVRAAELALQRNPNAFRPNWVVGAHLAKKGEEARAHAHYRTALGNFEGTDQLRLNFHKEYVGWLIRWAKRARGRIVRGENPAANRKRFEACLTEALRLLEPYYKQAPTNGEIANNLALIYQLAGQFNKAIEAARGIADKQLHHKKLLSELLYKRSLRSERKAADRERDLKEAIAVMGPAAPAKYEKALAAMRSEDLVRQGLAAYDAGKYDEALELLQRSGRKGYRVYLTLGLIHARKDPRKAFSYLELANAANPRKADALYHLGRVYEKLGGKRLADAFNRYQRYLSLVSRIQADPVRYPASGAELKRWSGWVPEAKRRLEALRGRFLAAMRKGDALYKARKFAEAARQFQTCVWIRPRDAEARYFLAVCLAESKNSDAAVKAFVDLLRVDSRNALAHFRLGVLYYGYGPERYAKATLHLKRSIALGLDPKVAEIARRYLAVMGKKGDE